MINDTSKSLTKNILKWRWAPSIWAQSYQSIWTHIAHLIYATRAYNLTTLQFASQRGWKWNHRLSDYPQTQTQRYRMRKFDPWPVFFKREFNRNWPFLVGFAITGTFITKFSLGLTGSYSLFVEVLQISLCSDLVRSQALWFI